MLMNFSIKKSKERLLTAWGKRGVRVGVSIATVFLLFVLLLPFAVKQGVQWWLVKNGAAEAVISSLSLNLFTGTLHVKGVDVQGAQKMLFATDGSGLKFDILGLFGKEIHIERTYYDHVTIQVKQEEDGQWKIASYTTPEQKENKPIEESKGSDWTILVDDVHITNSSVEFISPTFSTVVTIDDAQLTNFSTAAAAAPADFHFKGKIDKTPLVLEAGKLRVLPDLMVAGQINLLDFDTASLSPLLVGQLEKIAGLFSMAGQFKFEMKSDTTAFRYDGDVNLAKTHLKMKDINYLSDHTHWSGTVDAKNEWSQFIIDGALLLDGIALDLTQQSLSVDNKHLSFKGKTKVHLVEKGVVLTSDSTLISDGIIVKQTGTIYGHKHLKWQGTLGNKQDAQHYLIDGDLTLGGMNIKMADSGLALTNQDVQFAGSTDIDLSSALQITHRGSFVSKGFKVLVGEMDYGHDQLTWKGNISHKNGILTTSSSKGTLQLENISYSQAGASPLKVHLKNTSWAGTLSYSPVQDDIFASLALAGKVNAKGFAYALPGTMPLDIGLASIACNDLSVGRDGVHLGTSLIDGLSIYSPIAKRMALELQKITLTESTVTPKYMVSSRAGSFAGFQLFPVDKKDQHNGELEALTFTGFSWSPQSGVELKGLVAQALSLELERDTKGDLNLAKLIASLKDIESKVDGGQTGEEVHREVPAQGIQKSTPGVKVDKIELVGDNKILFTDHTLLVPYRSETVFKKFLIENIDTLNAKQDTLITVEALLEKRAPFTLSGKIRPFTKKPEESVSAQLQFKLRNYPLRNLSPYLVQAVGTGLESGQLKLQGTFKLEKGEVDIENKLLFKKLVTKAVAPELAKQLDNKLPVPLNTALGLLRDSDDNIALSIPISGPIDKLDFNLTNIFITALSKAVVPAASSYLMYALGPYGALAYVGMKIGQNILEVHLPPVNFVKGEEKLSVDQKDYLQRIGKIVKEGKANSDLQVVPVTNVALELGREGQLVADLSQEQRQKMLKLGQLRAQIIQKYLVEKQGVAAGKVLLSVTRLEDGSASSRVELQPEE
ncbi:hypothetical protein DP2852 [Desulfotalea psychrophila LSv54]|uniref:DUF748 domain-containing protein n=2 Tax=Desulfotalea psychrophila TaxID=84980 RepID=Q6AJ99_DESPS|nr:hypothetical protein DP2852 [Desulfotalea psychrophila LSv54]